MKSHFYYVQSVYRTGTVRIFYEDQKKIPKFSVDLASTYWINVKATVRFRQIFVAFLENPTLLLKKTMPKCWPLQYLLLAIWLDIPTKFHSFQERSCVILSSIKIMIIFDNTSAEIKTKSADALSRMIIILIELRIAQLCS